MKKLFCYKKYAYTFLFCFAFFFRADAQNYVFDWVKPQGGFAYSKITHDSLGNIYTYGDLASTADFDPGPSVFNLTSNGNQDVFVSKLDSNGNFLWAKQFGGAGVEQAHDMKIDAAGNVCITGRFYLTVDFNPGPGVFNLTSNGSWDIFVLKLDPNGNFIWAKQIGGPGYDLGVALVTDPSNNIYINGNFEDSADFDPGPNVQMKVSQGSSDMFICKLDAMGQLIWVDHIGNFNQGYLSSLAIDDSCNLFYTGFFQNIVDFDPGSGTFNMNAFPGDDIFVSKLDSAGHLVWAKQFPCSLYGRGGKIAVDHQGNVYSTGILTYTIDFDPGPGVYNLIGQGVTPWDLYLSKLDAQGNFVWAKQIIGDHNNIIDELTLDHHGNVYIAGTNKDTTDFDPSPNTYSVVSQGGGDIFIVQYDTSGNFNWHKKITTNFDESCHGLSFNKHGDLFASGYFKVTADFDPGQGVFNMTPSTTFGTFILKLNPCNSSTYATIFDTACTSYLSPSGNSLWTNSGTYIDTIANAMGCDSIITVNLIISNISTSYSFSVTACDTYTSPSNNFTWTNSAIYYDTIPNNSGCDSLLTINLTINNSSSTTISQVACNSYTSPSNLYSWTTSGTYKDTISNSSGCDSIINIQLTITQNVSATINPSVCNSYTSPSNNYSWTISGTYQDTILTTAGCDSFITINLTVNPTIDTSLINNSPVLTAVENGATYQWIDCSNANAPLIGKTSQSFTALANGNYAVIINKNGCVDTSTCYNIMNVGISEFSKEDFSIFPNPSNGKIFIDLTNTKLPEEIIMRNSMQQIISTFKTIRPENMEIVLPEITGVYLIEFIYKDKPKFYYKVLRN